MENYVIKINVLTFIIMFCFASEITKFYKNSKKRLLSVAIKCSIHMIRNEKLEYTTNLESVWLLF